MGQQYGNVQDGHEIDEVIFLLAGYQICTFCGSQVAGLSWRECEPQENWREDPANEQSWGVEGYRRALQSDRFNEVNDRVQKERSNGRLSGLWRNPSL